MMLQAQAIDANGKAIAFSKLFAQDCPTRLYINTPEILDWLKSNGAQCYVVRPVGTNDVRQLELWGE